MKHVFIVNPVSGKKDAGKAMIPQIRRFAEAEGIEYELFCTEGPKHATSLAAAFGKAGTAVRLYAVGGDGTLNEVLLGAYPYENAEVASVPVGSGNDFIRNYGTVEDFLDIPGQLRGQAIPIDLMEVDGGVCAAITSVGLDAEVAYGIPKYRRIPLLGGSVAYNISIIERLLSPMGNLLRVDIDGRVMEDKYLIATVCNGRYYGGGYCAAPLAKLADGVLEIILVRKISRLKIAGIIGKYKKGEHFDGDKIIAKFHGMIEHHRGKEITITPLEKESIILNVDGECGAAPRLYAKVMPLAARFVLPEKLYGKP